MSPHPRDLGAQTSDRPTAQPRQYAHLSHHGAQPACVREVVRGRPVGVYALWCHTHGVFGPVRITAAEARLDLCPSRQATVNAAVAVLCGLHPPQPSADLVPFIARTQGKV